ncbi:MAG: D-amino acid dehydrogenase [Burkholderiaceae bacterium]|nr:D-amino acid dehydrogenase [Burkholderiaceae bacterium]
MQVAVIGGGVMGVCTAYFLADAGHAVSVFERHGNVAEQASFGNAGIVAPAFATPWAVPGAPRKLFAALFKSSSPYMLKSRLDPAMWRWLSRWASESELQRFRRNRQRMQRIAHYSRSVLQQVRDYEKFDYEQTSGYLQLFRSERDLALAQPLLDLMMEQGVPHQVLDAEGARVIEPGLSEHAPLAGAWHFNDDATGNCALFTKQLKQAAQANGVDFQFGCTVKAIEAHGRRVGLQIDRDLIHADAVVIAAGIDSTALLAPLGISVPLYPVKGYAATAPIKDFEHAPLSAAFDDANKVSIARMGNRVRLAGLAEFGARDNELNEISLRKLVEIGEDWFPHAANYSGAQYWCGMRPMLPDGPPLVGASGVPGVYLNLGHGATGWTMAAGSGKLVADLVTGREPDIDTEGLNATRFHH